MSDIQAIEISNLRKQYGGPGGSDALRGLNLRVPAGSIQGFLGRNGAGKTTTIKALMGMVHPTSGEARVLGLDAFSPGPSMQIRRRTGFVADEKDLYGHFTVDEMIRFTSAFYPAWRADAEQRYRRAFELPPARKVKALSRGMRTKLALLLALSRGAELLILDEPTSGLDPATTEEVLQALVGHVARENMTVFFSSHQIAEVEQIADRIAIVDRGRVVVDGSLDDLRDRYRRVQFVFPGDAPAATFTSAGVVRVTRKGRVLSVLSSDGAGRVVEEARALGAVSVDVLPVTLKDMFLETVVSEV